MDWVLRSPQIHSTFGNLGFAHPDGYHINDNCNSALENILHNILIEDKYLRTYRRSISFGQNIKKDLIPLFINAKEDRTLELLVRILVNLTIPIKCLLSLDAVADSDFGRHTIFDINNLLSSAKCSFTDQRVTKVVIDFLKKNFDVDQPMNLTPAQCTNICNSLLLLRNILHIPETANSPGPTTHNQILWNIFSQSIDKILIKLMTIPEASNWSVTMVQLVALLYKDQHVVTLQKLLNLWLEASLSESSEDNESNTSPPDRSREDSSPMLTSDPTSDSSDTGGSGKCNDDDFNAENPEWRVASSAPANKMHDETTASNSEQSTQSDASGKKKGADTSDCGYATQIENQESVSTSSNEDELPAIKPVHQKPHNPKQRVNTKARTGATAQEKKRKKMKRARATIINVQGLTHTTPTDDDISNILKEFTVDFLLKGYNSLVQTLHTQILTNMQLEIDTSHFFWLVTYFLKFAVQIELDLEHVCSVLSYDIVSYMTAEGVKLCEQFELARKLDGNDVKPSGRRLHLLVTAIRQFIQAIKTYLKMSHICQEDKEILVKLQMKMCEMEELRFLFVLLLRHYNPKYHSKRYLQDLIVTNHNLMLFVDSVMKLPEYDGATTSIAEHLKQFATPEIMYQYGLLLEDYADNGEFVNDCVFTMMHHVGGDLGCLIALYQPKILKAFTSIWETEFEICDDWSDLIEYVINTFIKKPHTLQMATNVRLDEESFEEEMCQAAVAASEGRPPPAAAAATDAAAAAAPALSHQASGEVDSDSCTDRWTENELSSLNWNYMQCNTSPDVIGDIIRMYKDDGTSKSRESVINQLYTQNIIVKEEYEKLKKSDIDTASKHCWSNQDNREDEIAKLCEQIKQDGKSKFLDWTQKVLLDTCYAKIYLEKKAINSQICTMSGNTKVLNFEIFKKKSIDTPVMSPVSYHCILMNESIPLVPYNIEQAAVTKDLKFLQLLHKLGLHMPVDTGKLFIRIPNYWTSDLLYETAGKILPIDTSKLKFSINDISDSGVHSGNFTLSVDVSKHIAADMFHIQMPNHLPSMLNFTPMPSTSFSAVPDVAANEMQKQNWLEVVQRSQELNLSLAHKNVCGTASVTSDLMYKYVSDEEAEPAAAWPEARQPGKRPRVHYDKP